MCEWLSRGEWCDVKLLCGRRSFSAHRAVLASVSTFLRRILLTCSSDEAVTYILLPDFDLEAMASVLYYIYNGEVNLQKGNLRPFLDIIQIMQIHIDGQYLPEIQEFYSIEKYFEVEKHCATSILHSNIFTLGFKEDADQHIFCIKKCKEMQRALLKYSHSDFDIHDNVVRRQNESKVDESRLGNLKSPHEDRQRNSLLRDLFIETYPRNGNVNGLTESVLAISNECYHSPASVLLANANCRHLSIEGTQTRPSKNATSHPPTSSDVLGEDVFREAWNKGLNHLPNSQLYNYSGNESLVYGNTDVYFNFNNYIYTGGNQSHNKYEVPESFDINKIVLDTEVHKNSQSSGDLILDNLISKNQSVRKNSSKKFKYNRSPKPIFNHVLESPWNARKPNNYRPFRRKEQKEIQSHSIQVGPNVTGNDTNNNIQISIQTSDENKTKLTLGDQELIDTTTIIANEESFKCSHCDQVFTSGEALVVHMRRHSTNARYTCGECGKTFSQLRNFKYHMSIHRGTREFAATCTVCGKYFNDRGYLSSHMKIHRNRKEYKCTLCPKSFNQRVAYNMHVRIHTGVKPHVCEECGKAFSRKMLLKQHQRTHSGERPYACPHCDKRFADRSNMTLHLRLHTGVKPFSCPMCPKSFTKKHHLKSHLNFHTGSKPYSCPRCSLAFTQSSNMRTHYKKCTAPGPSTSNDCTNSLVTPS